ncbi:hypothetical protein BD413DRAFT_489769 [Trametes elegans]|nr:hypothetical protein BD413DRAFT_489769 [Trametes elegans]
MSFTTSDSTAGPAAISVQSADGTSTPSDVSCESSPAATPAADTECTQSVDAFVLDAPASASGIVDGGLAPPDIRCPSLLPRPRPGAGTDSDDEDDDDEDAFIPRGTQTNGSAGVKKPSPSKPTKP